MGQGLSIKDVIKTERSDLRRKQRVIQREITMMEMELEKVTRNLKREVKKRNVINAKYIAKNYSMVKKNINNLYKMKNQMDGLCIQIQTMGSQHEINEAMKRVTMAMKALNSNMNLESVKNIIKDFENEKLKNEVTGEMLDTLMEGDDEDEETEEEILNKICDELHIDLIQDVAEPPTENVIYGNVNHDDKVLEDMESRLNQITSHDF